VLDKIYKYQPPPVTTLRIIDGRLFQATFVASLIGAAFSSHYLHNVHLAKALTVTGIYNSSKTPHSLPWNTYNYCNAPHVNHDHYVSPPVGDAKPVYTTIMMRHHKVREYEYASSYISTDVKLSFSPPAHS
jgi:hypothetical protein